jgi:hypothetical protein
MVCNRAKRRLTQHIRCGLSAIALRDIGNVVYARDVVRNHGRTII